MPLDSPEIGSFQNYDSASPEVSAGKPSSGSKIRLNFDEQMQREFARAQAGGNPVALMAIEIDHFGTLDEHDESVRQDLVRNVASIVSRHGRQGDTAAQYGSKEFAVILPDTNTADAYCLAEAMREEIEGTCMLAGLHPKAVWVTVSIGLALFPRDANSTRELFAAAVAGVLEAQRNGGNRVVLHSELEFQAGTRREQRYPVALPVQLWGMDIDGVLFAQEAVTVDITTTGARLRGIVHRLQRGCVVGVKHQNSKARYRVVWISEGGSPPEVQAGLQLIDGGKFIWGRALPRLFGDDQFVAVRSRPDEPGE